MKRSTLAAVTAVATLMACVDVPDSETIGFEDGELSLIAYDAALVDAKVSIYATDENLQPVGEPLYQDLRTDELGRVATLKLDRPTEVLYLKAGSAGSYYEEATNTRVYLESEDFLQGLILYREGESQTATISGFSSMAAAYAQCVVSNFGESPKDVLAQTNRLFADMYGVDVSSLWPLNPTIEPQDNENANAIVYGHWAAGVSQFMVTVAQEQSKEPHSRGYRSLDFYQLAMRDILEDENCALDGKIDLATGPASLGWGDYEVTASTYRAEHARAALAFINSTNNNTSTTEESFIRNAEQLTNVNDSRMFAGIDPAPLDGEAPRILLQYADGEFVSGVLNYQVVVEDDSEVSSLALYIGDTLHAMATGKNVTFTAFDTLALDDGEVMVRVTATDEHGHESEASHRLQILNGAPLVTLLSEPVVGAVDYDFAIRVDSLIGVTNVTIGGSNVLETSDGEYRRSFSLSNGLNNIVVTAEDQLGNVSNETIQIFVDRTAPELSVDYSDSSYRVVYSTGANRSNTQESGINWGSALANPFQLTAEKVALNGLQPTIANLSAAKIPYLEFTISDAASGQPTNLTPEPSDLSVSYRYFRNGVEVTNDAMVAVSGTNGSRFILPFTEETLGSDWFLVGHSVDHQVRVRVQDPFGNQSERNFTFNGRFFIEQPEFNASINSNRYSNHSLANLPAANSLETVATYRYENDTGVPVTVSRSNWSPTNVTHRYRVGERVHRYYRDFSVSHTFRCSTGTYTFSANDQITYLELGTQIQRTLSLPSSTSTTQGSVNSDNLPANSSVAKNYWDNVSLTRVHPSQVNPDFDEPPFPDPVIDPDDPLLGTGTVHMDGMPFRRNGNVVCYLLEESVDFGGLEPPLFEVIQDGMNNDSRITRYETNTFRSMSGYPRNETEDRQSSTQASSYVYEARINGNLQSGSPSSVTLQPGQELEFAVRLRYPSLSVRGTNCTWSYTERSCDLSYQLSTPISATFNVTPNVASGTGTPVAYSHSASALVSTID